jgi:virulence factor Mce-like protein
MRLSEAGRNRLLGLGFVFLAALAVVLLLGKFKGSFDTTPTVALQVPAAGSQLNSQADVKVRGLIIGDVKKQKVSNDGKVVTLTLAISKHDMALIPQNVTARLLPKTLFGEKYVDLQIPTNPSPEHLHPGDTIAIDQSKQALEIEKVLADFTYLLRDLEPVKVNTFLNNLSGALADRGNDLGQALVQFDNYAKSIQPNIPTIQNDISGLADLAKSLDTNSSDLLDLARNAARTGTTVTSKQNDLLRFLQGTADFADTTTNVFQQDGQSIITIAAESRPQLEALEQLNSKIGPGVHNLNNALADLVDPKFGALRQGPFLNVVLYPQTSRGAYTNADCARFPGANGPNCPAGTPTEPAASASINPRTDKSQLNGLVGSLMGESADKVSSVAGFLWSTLLSGTTVSAP